MAGTLIKERHQTVQKPVKSILERQWGKIDDLLSMIRGPQIFKKNVGATSKF